MVSRIWPMGSRLESPSLDLECQAEILELGPRGNEKPLR